jgi:hypothetical protein
MGLIEEVQELKSSGASEDKIVAILQERGYTKRDILDGISQSQIRDAVSSDNEAQYAQESSYQESQRDISPSLTNEKVPQAQEYTQEPQYNYQEPQYTQYDQSSYAPQNSADTISEISEQIVSEKLSPIREQLEKIIDMRNNFEARTAHLDERLKRIESILDKLQMAILERVGDYASNLQSIKDEMIETQKSFKSLLNKTSSFKDK